MTSVIGPRAERSYKKGVGALRALKEAAMGEPQVSDPKDVELESSIQRAIRQMGTGIHVKVWGGHVTLAGHVDSFETKREIASIVRRMPTIRKVTNNLRVMPGLG
jgi:hypothetical protein